MSTCPSAPRSASHLRAGRRPCRKSLRRYQGNRCFRPAPGEPRSRAACRLRPRRVAASAEVMSPMPLSLGTCCGSDASYPLPGEAASGRGLPDRARGGAGGGLTRVWLSPLAGGVRAAGTSARCRGCGHLTPAAAGSSGSPEAPQMGHGCF